MTRKLPLMLGALALSLAPMMAQAQGMGMLPPFEMLDRNQSGSVTLEDFQAALEGGMGARHEHVIARLMEQADADGRLDEAALRAGFAALQEEWRTRRETGGQDGRAEMLDRMFARIDANDDGEISAEEYAAFGERMSDRMERRGQHGRGHHGGRW